VIPGLKRTGRDIAVQWRRGQIEDEVDPVSAVVTKKFFVGRVPCRARELCHDIIDPLLQCVEHRNDRGALRSNHRQTRQVRVLGDMTAAYYSNPDHEFRILPLPLAVARGSLTGLGTGRRESRYRDMGHMQGQRAVQRGMTPATHLDVVGNVDQRPKR
jgi:hypothetical protein